MGITGRPEVSLTTASRARRSRSLTTRCRGTRRLAPRWCYQSPARPPGRQHRNQVQEQQVEDQRHPEGGYHSTPSRSASTAGTPPERGWPPPGWGTWIPPRRGTRPGPARIPRRSRIQLPRGFAAELARRGDQLGDSAGEEAQRQHGRDRRMRQPPHVDHAQQQVRQGETRQAERGGIGQHRGADSALARCCSTDSGARSSVSSCTVMTSSSFSYSWWMYPGPATQVPGRKPLRGTPAPSR